MCNRLPEMMKNGDAGIFPVYYNSERPPSKGGNCQNGRDIACKDKKSSWDLDEFPNVGNIEGSTVVIQYKL